MTSAAIAPTPSGLAPTLVRKIFSVYFGLAMAVTALQIGLDYRQTYSQVVDELNSATLAFQPGVSDAVWNFQQTLAESIAKGAVDGHLVLGAHIRDLSGHVKVDITHGGLSLDQLDVSRRVELKHVDRDGVQEPIGEMVLYSNHAVVLGRVQFQVVLALAMSMLKTAGLWIIIAYYANRMLARPLRQWTEQVALFDVAHATQAPKIDIGREQNEELHFLCDAFNDLGERVVENRRQLAELAASLEQRVKQRTLELSAKNEALHTEISVRQAAQQAVTRERDFSLALVRSIPEIFVLVTSSGGVVMANPNAQRSLGIANAATANAFELVAPAHRDVVTTMLGQVFTDGEATCEADLMFDDARPVPHYLVAHRVQLEDSVCSIVVAVDISVRRQAEEQMRHMAMYDTLTDLPNRAMLQDRLAQITNVAMRRNHSMAILFMDLDGFKAINDTHGHDAGDAVLRTIARRLEQTVRASDLVARYGGDEFVIVLASVSHDVAASKVAQKLIDRVSVPIDWEGHQLHVGASIGISLLPQHTSDAVSLMEQADAAMYRAKRRGKGCFELATTLNSAANNAMNDDVNRDGNEAHHLLADS